MVVESRMEDGSGEGWRKGEGAFSFTELVKYLSYLLILKSQSNVFFVFSSYSVFQV